jgi:hypothetical protein
MNLSFNSCRTMYYEPHGILANVFYLNDNLEINIKKFVMVHELLCKIRPNYKIYRMFLFRPCAMARKRINVLIT